MSEANLSTVKNDLSRFVARARKGERVRILVNGVAAAALVPIEDLGDENDELAELERRGVATRGRGAGSTRALLKPGPRVVNGAVMKALDWVRGNDE